jgi:hypothetical protein
VRVGSKAMAMADRLVVMVDRLAQLPLGEATRGTRAAQAGLKGGQAGMSSSGASGNRGDEAVDDA